MSQATLQRILSEVEELSSEEKAKLILALQSDADPANEEGRIEAFHQALLASGLVTEIKPKRAQDRPLQLIDIPGRPVSETLVDERR